MSADWQPGDLAVCVNDKPCPVYGDTGYREGRIYTVTKVKRARDKITGAEGEGLKTAENPSEMWRRSDCFRKVVSDKPEACEEEFLTLLKRSKRSVQA